MSATAGLTWGAGLAAGILLANALVSAWPAAAQQQVTPVAPEMRACEVLAGNDSWQVRTSLSTFQAEVLGRNTLDWTAGDFDRVIQAAQTCDGYTSKRMPRTVWYKDWNDQMLAARNFVMPVVDGFRLATRKAEDTPHDLLRVPTCPKLLDWRFEPRTFSSSVRNLFGAGLFELSSKDLRAIAQFAGDCANGLSIYATGRFQIPQQRTIQIVSDIVQVVNAIATAKEEEAKAPHHSTDVVAKLDGSEVPAGLAHERMQIVVRRFNQVSLRGEALSGDAISDLENGVADVLNRSDITSVDNAFGDAIKARISANIFGTKPGNR